jgi:hypothetical protein
VLQDSFHATQIRTVRREAYSGSSVASESRDPSTNSPTMCSASPRNLWGVQCHETVNILYGRLSHAFRDQVLYLRDVIT